MKKSLVIACAVMLATAATMTAIYVKQNNDKQQQEESQLAAVDTEEMLGMQADTESVPQGTSEKVAAADSIVVPESQDVNGEEETIAAEEEDSELIAETMADNSGNVVLHFTDDTSVNWPLQGTVLMNYSMDQTTYFATLDQYKYNPAIIIGCNVNDRVNCAVDGVVTDISTNEVTGCTVTMDIGDGYSVIYGQLKQVPYEEGAMVMQGSLVGYVAEPTKYYSEEGCNLYFAMEKDGVPVDPASFFE
ncbi:MAG: peptidoglycan DD-metalloendopeptidase family protein [Roseburia sp.]